ncbi:MAG: hypothetical protein ABSD73_12380 [Candidatus Bathyarchaeia archaeon]|jgi:hypothetical protein
MYSKFYQKKLKKTAIEKCGKQPRKVLQAVGDASRPWPFETILISILLEHEKALAELKSKIKAQEEQVGYERKGNT